MYYNPITKQYAKVLDVGSDIQDLQKAIWYIQDAIKRLEDLK